VTDSPAPGNPAPEPPALPRSFEARYGDGVSRGVCLGGGGTWFVAWQVGYLQALAEHDVHIDEADRFVGTSAGSIVAATLAQRHLHRMYLETRAISKLPKLIGSLFPSAHDEPSQQRALDLYTRATDADPETVIGIGHAALAAITPDPEAMPRSLFPLIGRGWDSDALWMTCIDTFTGERCVLTRAAGVAVNHGAAASCAVPGIFAPQPVLGRRCMDGGVSGSATHLDLLAGADKALVLSLFVDAELTESMLTLVPGGLGEELDQLRASGTTVFSRAPGQHPWQADELMDPTRIPGAMEAGRRQGEADAEELTDFWA
jgi:NTE family protein